jgi:hypothetical protein
MNRASSSWRKRASNSDNKHLFISNIIQAGAASLAIDGNEDNSLQNCAVMDNYNTERPTFIIDLGRFASIGGIILKTWQGQGQDSNFAYRDYMYGLDRFSVFVDKRKLNNNNNNQQPLEIEEDDNEEDNEEDKEIDQFSNEKYSLVNQNSSIITNSLRRRRQGYRRMYRQRFLRNSINSTATPSGQRSNQLNTAYRADATRLRLNEYNLCNFVTRMNYALFQPEIHLQCKKPIIGRYIYIQADGRSNRWNRLFSAVLCEIKVYEF